MERRLFGLDALRGIAALVVLQMHVSSGLQGGHLAVDFFFMLSGYVIARSYESRLVSGAISPGTFVLMRYRRFWPTMAVGATLGLAAALLVFGLLPELLLAFVFALLMIPGSATTPYFLNLPAWSIFYELVANAVHGAAFSKMSNFGLLIVLAIAAAGLVLSLQITGFPRILPETTLVMQVLVIFRLLASYVIGILLFRLFKDQSPVRLPFALGALLLPAYVLLVALYPFTGWQLPFIFLVAPIMIFCGLAEDVPKRLSVILGGLSFPLYAVHLPIIQLGLYLGFRNPIIMVAASLAVASLWLVPWRRLVGALMAGRTGSASKLS